MTNATTNRTVRVSATLDARPGNLGGKPDVASVRELLAALRAIDTPQPRSI